MEWMPYPRNRKVAYRKGYAIIIPESFNSAQVGMPLFCEVCKINFKRNEDEKAYKLFGCCMSCADTWAYSNKEEWLKGWRPDVEKIEKAVEKRLFVNPHIVFE